MLAAKHTPFAILGLILASALSVLIIGSRFAKEDREVTIKQDNTPLSSFAERLHNEIENLNSLYKSHLIDICDQISPNSSNIEIISICREIIGVEQATLFKSDRPPVHLDLRESDRSTPLPLPRRSGDSSPGNGLIVDVGLYEAADSNAEYQWIEQSSHPPHFVAKLDNKTILVLRINPAKTAQATESGLEDWLPNAFAPISVAGITAVVQNPAGKIIASTENAGSVDVPSLILPIPSVFGEWKISSWDKTETVTGYRQPVLIGFAALSVVLSIAGIFGFTQQQRAFRTAEQQASFVNRVSHELRTPMTNIQLNIDLLTDSLSGDNPNQVKRLNLIREEASRLNRLLENVLTFSRLEKTRGSTSDAQQSLKIIPCDVNQIIDSVLSQFSAALSRKKILVRRPESNSTPFVLADPDAFSQIISNLISNVEKYAANGEKLDLHIDTSPNCDAVMISITDYGPGIPESEILRIFHPFVRLSDATTDGVSGTGLGLAIARDLAESMKGTLVLEPDNSEDRSGCHFILTLPLAAQNIVSLAS